MTKKLPDSLVPVELLKAVTGRFVVTHKMLVEYPGNLKDLTRQFDDMVYANPDYIFTTQWGFDGAEFIIEWVKLPEITHESRTDASSNHQSPSALEGQSQGDA